jgi:phenylacetate-coenzyme A ligase PaaK-like adenylate-forming protein
MGRVVAIMKYLKKLLWNLAFFALRQNAFQNIQQLKSWQGLNREGVISLQQERLKYLLSHAYAHVPYYHKLLKNSRVVNNSGAVNLECISNIPLLDKDLIRKNFEDLKSDDLSVRNWYKNSSGGSTGEPVILIQDKAYRGWSIAVKKLFDEWSGYTIGDKKIQLWGSERDLLVGRETLKTEAGRWLANTVWLNAFCMPPVKMRHFVEKINDLKPVQILAYAASIYELSLFIEQEGLEVSSPNAIMTSAGTLYPHMRETIERVFQSPVFNRYGSREVSDIACECDHHKGLHISALTHYVEIIRPDGSLTEPGEMGEIVVTLLTNYAMPLIRYRIGDMGVWSEDGCTCGRAWPLMKEVKGRLLDTFVKKDGTLITEGPFDFLFYHGGWVKRFQVIQEDYESVRILLVLGDEVKDPYDSLSGEFKEIIDQTKKIMGRDCNVNIEIVSDIKPTASGKYRYIMSKVAR